MPGDVEFMISVEFLLPSELTQICTSGMSTIISYSTQNSSNTVLRHLTRYDEIKDSSIGNEIGDHALSYISQDQTLLSR